MIEDTITIKRTDYEELLDRIEDLEAALALIQAQRADDGTRIPIDVVDAEIAGAHPVAAWRAYRGMTVEDLARRAGLAVSEIAGIESNDRDPDTATVHALSGALDVPADLLTPESAEQ